MSTAVRPATPNARRVYLQLLGVCVGVPFTAVVGFAMAVPPFLGAAESVRDAVVTAAALADLALTVLAAVFATVYLPVLRRAARAPARVAPGDRVRLLAVPRRAAQWLLGAALVIFLAGYLPPGHTPLAGLRVAAASTGAGALLMAALVLYPAVGRALRPLLEAIAPPREHTQAAMGDRLAVRVALTVGIPTGVAALLACQIVTAHLDATARTQEEASARAYSLALGVPRVPGEARPAENPAVAVLTSRAVVLLPGVQFPQAQVRVPEAPSQSWAIPLAVAIGALGAALGWRVGRSAVRELDAATARMASVASGATLPPPASGTVPEVQAMARALDAVAARLAAMATDQRRALTARAEAARLRSFVLAGVSHDLRGPLNSVLGFAGLLLSGVDGDVTPGQRESLEALTHGGRDLLRLVDDLLDAARLDAGRMTLDRRHVTVGGLLAAAREAALERAGNIVGADLDLPAEGDLSAVVTVDSERAARALGALMAYALLRPGAGGTVAMRVRAAHDGRVAVAMAGSGVSPPRESLAQLFDPFDVAPAGARAPAGLGLAVGVARRVIDLHGGVVQARAIPEGGLLLVVELPGLGG